MHLGFLSPAQRAWLNGNKAFERAGVCIWLPLLQCQSLRASARTIRLNGRPPADLVDLCALCNSILCGSVRPAAGTNRLDGIPFVSSLSKQTPAGLSGLKKSGLCALAKRVCCKISCANQLPSGAPTSNGRPSVSARKLTKQVRPSSPMEAS